MLHKAITIYLLVCISFCSAKSINLLDHYKEPLPVTFGMWLDLQLKVFSYKHSDWSKKTKVFIAKSGALQMKIEFQANRLPGDKNQIEDFIEDTSMKIKLESEQLVQGLWSLFPGKIPYAAFEEQHDLVSTFVFLDGKQIGWAAGDNFHWKRKKRTWDVITNHFRGKSKLKATKKNSRKR